MYDLSGQGREAALGEAKREAIAAAISAGADARSVEIIDVQEMPMTHMRAGAVQIRIRAAGPLAALASQKPARFAPEISR
jgi:hypothetical protein